MFDHHPHHHSVSRNALVAIAVVVSGAAIYWLRGILTPLALAVFLMIMIDSFVRVLRTRAAFLPDWAPMPVALLVSVVLFGLTAFLIAGGAAFAALSAGAAAAADTPYASNAIASGQLAEAERVLKAASFADAKDPARLINLATVYLRTQRFEEARDTLKLVRQLPDESLILSGGVSYSSHGIAAAIMNRLP